MNNSGKKLKGLKSRVHDLYANYRKAYKKASGG